MTRYVEPFQQVLDASGDATPGAKLTFFRSLTVIEKTVYTDSALTIPHASPVVADAAGRFPAIFLDSSDHRVVLTDADDVQIRVSDPVSGLPSESELQLNFQTGIENFVATAGQTLFTLTENTYETGKNQLLVFITGAAQVPVLNFTESSSTTFTLTSGADEGDNVAAVVGIPVSNTLSSFDTLSINDGADLVIAAGVITSTGSSHKVDTEAMAASDDLDTVNGGATGRLLILRSTNSARTVVAKDATGNMELAGDFSMTSINDRLTLQFDGTSWIELSRSSNG